MRLQSSSPSPVATGPARRPLRPRQRQRLNAARLVAADSEPGQWMSHGRTYDEQRFSPLDQIRKTTSRNWASPGSRTWTRIAARKPRRSLSTASYASRRRGARSRRPRGDRPTALGIRPGGAGWLGGERLLRRSQPRRRRMGRQGVRRHDRRASRGARRRDGEAALGREHDRQDEAVHDYRCASRGERPGAHRQRRRRARRARLRLRV